MTIGGQQVVVLLAAVLDRVCDRAATRFCSRLVILANALLRFIWSHRLFGYCAIMMAAVPNDHLDPSAAPRARQSAEINITAARSFNRGLNSVYFALASLGWLIGPLPLLVATGLTAGVLLRREFASHSRQVMLDDMR